MAEFTYDPSTLEDASKSLANGASEIDSQLTALSSRISPLQEGFQGQAAAAFQELWTEWHTSGKKLMESLTGLSQLLHGASVNAAQMEQANVQMMGRG